MSRKNSEYKEKRKKSKIYNKENISDFISNTSNNDSKFNLYNQLVNKNDQIIDNSLEFNEYYIDSELKSSGNVLREIKNCENLTNEEFILKEKELKNRKIEKEKASFKFEISENLLIKCSENLAVFYNEFYSFFREIRSFSNISLVIPILRILKTKLKESKLFERKIEFILLQKSLKKITNLLQYFEIFSNENDFEYLYKNIEKIEKKILQLIETKIENDLKNSQIYENYNNNINYYSENNNNEDIDIFSDFTDENYEIEQFEEKKTLEIIEKIKEKIENPITYNTIINNKIFKNVCEEEEIFIYLQNIFEKEFLLKIEDLECFLNRINLKKIDKKNIIETFQNLKKKNLYWWKNFIEGESFETNYENFHIKNLENSFFKIKQTIQIIINKLKNYNYIEKNNKNNNFIKDFLCKKEFRKLFLENNELKLNRKEQKILFILIDKKNIKKIEKKLLLKIFENPEIILELLENYKKNVISSFQNEENLINNDEIDKLFNLMQDSIDSLKEIFKNQDKYSNTYIKFQDFSKIVKNCFSIGNKEVFLLIKYYLKNYEKTDIFSINIEKLKINYINFLKMLENYKKNGKKILEFCDYTKENTNKLKINSLEEENKVLNGKLINLNNINQKLMRNNNALETKIIEIEKRYLEKIDKMDSDNNNLIKNQYLEKENELQRYIRTLDANFKNEIKLLKSNMEKEKEFFLEKIKDKNQEINYFKSELEKIVKQFKCFQKE